MNKLARLLAITSALSIAAFAANAFVRDGLKFQEDGIMTGPRFDTGGRVVPGYESGQYNGQHYTINSNGEGKVRDWHIACQQDAMTDKRYCSVIAPSGSLAILMDEQGCARVGVGYEHAPSSTVMIRIDSSPAQTTKVGGWQRRDATQMLPKLTQAQRITTRFVKWPSNAPTDSVIPAAGLQEAVDLATWAIRAK